MSNPILTGLSIEIMLESLTRATGARPSVKVENGNSVIYWQGEELLKMQSWLQEQTKAKPYDPNGMNITFDWLPVVEPMLAMPALLLAAGAAGMFVLGRVTK